jgi:hypothetical protein
MKQGIYRNSSARLALMLTLAAIAIGCPAVASATPPSDTSGSYRPSEWASTSSVEGSGKAPSLTTKVETLELGNSSQLWLGYSLVGVGMLVLVYGLAVRVRTPRAAQQGLTADTSRLGRANRARS